MGDGDNLFGDVIFSYSRVQAIADGVLVDVTPVARAADFKVPLALTAAVWARCIEVPDDARNQSELLRQWNLFWHVHHAMRRAREGAPHVTFQIETCDGSGLEERVEFDGRTVVAGADGGDQRAAASRWEALNMKTKQTRRPVRVSEAVMALVDWEEKLKVAARSFTTRENDDTHAELKVAGYGYGHWRKELEKAKKREGL